MRICTWQGLGHGQKIRRNKRVGGLEIIVFKIVTCFVEKQQKDHVTRKRCVNTYRKCKSATSLLTQEF